MMTSFSDPEIMPENGCGAGDVRISRPDGITVRFLGPVPPAEILMFQDKAKTLFFCEKCINYGKQ